MLKRFCYQSYHQTGVTSCTVIIHPWCFTVFTGIHHCCPRLALRAATGTIVLNPCLGGSKTRCRHGELPVVQRKHRGLSVVSWSLSRHASHYTSLSSKSSALFHNKGVQTHEQSDTIRTKLEQKNDNQHPKKHVETRWNMLNTPNVQTYTNMMHIQSAPHQGFPLGSPGRVLSCTVVAGSRHDTLTVIGATFNPLSRRWELESLPKQKRGGFKGIQGLTNPSWNTAKKAILLQIM